MVEYRKENFSDGKEAKWNNETKGVGGKFIKFFMSFLQRGPDPS